MYKIIQDILVQLLNIPTGEFTNWLIFMCVIALFLMVLFK